MEPSQAQIVYGYILDQLNRSGDYQIVERSELDKALQEMELAASDIVDESTAVVVGEITGAE